MGYLRKFQFDEPKLILFYLGGRAKGCNIELHDVVFAVCKNFEDAKKQLPEKWFGTPESLHVDSWFPIENVDGFDVELSREKPSDRKLFFLNIGAYENGELGEKHYFELVVAKDKKTAKELGKARLNPDLHLIHTDDIYEVDDCIELSTVDGYHVCLKEDGERTNPPPENGWFRLPK